MGPAICLFFFAAANCLAGEVANVTLVVNDRSPVSRRLANFYADWHGLGPQQLCHIATGEVESISRADFDKEISGPLKDCLRRTGRVESTYYVVLTQGMPIRVSAQTRGDWHVTDGASVDSEVALLYLELHGAKLKREGPLDNPFYRRKEQVFAHPAMPIYLVTRLAGYSFEDARRAVERCRGAKNTGKVVLDLKADNDEEGNNWLRDAGILLPEDRVLIDVTPGVVSNVRDVIGYASWGSNDRARKSRKSGMAWLPGAIATEFVSSNGRTLKMPPYNWTLGRWEDSKSHYAGSPQSMMLDYVWEGASGVSGNVDEPYLSMTARPDQLFAAYLSGRNLAESFYLALPALSWQSIVVGDPLCRLESR